MSQNKKENEIKRYLGIEFSRLAPWRGQIDIIDDVIIAYIVDWARSDYAMTMHYKDGEYVWIDYQYLLNQIPDLKIGYYGLKKRLRRLCEIGVFDRKTEYHKKNGHRATFYRVPKELLKRYNKDDFTDDELPEIEGLTSVK